MQSETEPAEALRWAEAELARARPVLEAAGNLVAWRRGGYIDAKLHDALCNALDAYRAATPQDGPAVAAEGQDGAGVGDLTGERKEQKNGN